MAEVKWIKITTDIFDDDKIMLLESMPEGETLLVIWLKILTLAGKTNSNGFLMMNERIAYTDEMLATIFRRDLKIVRLALSTFEQFDMIEIIDNKILITHWEKHQNADALDKIREQTRKRVAKHRQKLLEGNVTGNVTTNATVTHGNATDIDIDIEIDIERDKEKDINIEVVDGQKSERFIDVVEANLGRGLVKFEFDMLNDYLYQRSVSKDLFLEAVKIAVANNVRKFNYIARILDNWIAEGIKTPEQAMQAQRDFKAKKANKAIQQSSPHSNVPEWSNEEYKNETTEEEKVRLEKIKQETLNKLSLGKNE